MCITYTCNICYNFWTNVVTIFIYRTYIYVHKDIYMVEIKLKEKEEKGQHMGGLCLGPTSRVVHTPSGLVNEVI
jgi:hypothetical protein